MTTRINRRTALLGSVTLPAAMAPLKFVQAADKVAEPANATDAAWAKLGAEFR